MEHAWYTVPPMTFTCPHCRATLDWHPALVAPPVVESAPERPLLEIVGEHQPVTVRQVAEAMVGRRATLAEVERARRRLNLAVLDGMVQVRNEPTPGGRPLTVYALTTTQPATG